MMSLMRDPVLYTVMYKGNAVQTDNVNVEVENVETYKDFFAKAMYDKWIPNKLIGCLNFSSTMTSKESSLELIFELLYEEFVAVIGSGF